MDTFKFSGKIVCGADSLSSLVSLIDSRVMIVTDKAMVELGHLDEIKKIISSKGLDFKVFYLILVQKLLHRELRYLKSVVLKLL